MTQPVVRKAKPLDRTFLRAVYASTRAEEMARTGWDDAACEAFVTLQFDAQEAHYRHHFPHADLGVLELGSGNDTVPVGRLWVDRRANSLHVLDITVLAGFRGRGIGTTCLRRLMAEAADRQVPLTIKVELFNPARRLYERLGFVDDGECGMHVQMAWHARATASSQETQDEQA